MGSSTSLPHTDGDQPSPASLEWLPLGNNLALGKPLRFSARDLILLLSLLDHGLQVAGC